jgi:hypothetical protein
MKVNPQQSRVDALLRLVALFVFILGILMVYFTYQNSNVTGMSPVIVPVYYGIGISLMITGFIGFISKYR